MKSPFPKNLKPMLASLGSPPKGSGWLYEIKWDGYRALALCNKDKVSLMSRNNKSFDDKFYPIHQKLKSLNLQAVLDGEIVVLNSHGLADFGLLQNWRSEADGEMAYYVFDILWYKGQDLMHLPLIERKKILANALPKDDLILVNEFYTASLDKLMKSAKKLGLEGLIAKKEDSRYFPGERKPDWVKIKLQERQEAVIGGYTINEGSPKLFSALLVGVYEKQGLHYIGKVGTGFSDKLQKEMMLKFKPLIIKKCPFAMEPDVNVPSRFKPNPPHASVTWLSPKLVAEVSFTEMTQDGIMRHPSFEGLRIDKEAQDVHPEILPTKKKQPAKKGVRKTLLNPTEETQVKSVSGHEVKFGHLSKVYFPSEGITKRDLLNYYYQVAPIMVPYLKNRPQSLNRFPNGIEGISFYQKDVTAKAPDWIMQYPYRTSDGKDKNFLVVQDEADLLWMANLGAIEMNPWNSTILKPDYPTWCIIDIDPSEKNTFEQVIVAAKTVKNVLDDLKVPSYCKTSGATGLHIYIPLGNKYTYDQCQMFGRLIATRVQELLPRFTSIERMTEKRKGKVYIDFLQNRPKATLAAPYSVRPRPGAPVSMPLHWDEVKKGLNPSKFNIKNALERIKSEGDLFKQVLGK